jgi:hypothetical protein
MNDYANRGEGGARPDITSYNTVLTAASYPGGNPKIRLDALRIAKATFDEIMLSRHVKADKVTYGTMLQAVERLADPGKAKVNYMETIFLQACADGQDGRMAINEIHKVLPRHEVTAARTRRTP